MAFNGKNKEDVKIFKEMVDRQRSIDKNDYKRRVLEEYNTYFNSNIGREAIKSKIDKYAPNSEKGIENKNQINGNIKPSNKTFNSDGTISLIEVIELTKEQKDSPEAIMEAMGYNPNNFKARTLTLNVWQQNSVAKGLVNLYQVKIILEPLVKALSMDDMIKIFDKKLKTIKPLNLPKPIISKEINNELLMESPAKELHHGKKYLDEMTSKERLMRILDETIELQEVKKCGTLYDGFGSDLFNSEANQATTAGTPMDNLMPYEEMFDTLIEMYTEYYIELRKHFKRIDVNLIRGNHDFNISFAAYRLLSRAFKNDNIIHFNSSYEMTQVYEFGKCAIFSNHGDFSNGKPLQRYLGSIVKKYHKILGRTKHWTARLYHLHSLYAFDDVTGIECTRLQAPTGPDDWHDKKNYTSEPKFPIFILDKEHGEVDRHYVKFDEIIKKKVLKRK